MMDKKRAVEIIGAYGGYPAAWPDDERSAVQALVAGDASLMAMMSDARALDRALSDWACGRVPATDADAVAAAAAALVAVRKAPARRRWFPGAAAGGLLAASLVATVLMSRPESLVPAAPTPAAGVEIALASLPGEQVEAAQDMLVWGSVFTPTPAEETIL